MRTPTFLLGMLLQTLICTSLPLSFARQEPSPEGASQRTPSTVPTGEPLPERALARLGPSRFRPGGLTVRIAFARQLVAACNQESIRVWDFPGGKERLRVGTGKGTPVFLGFSKDGKRLECACTDGDLRRWDIETWRDLKPIRSGFDSADSFAVSPDGGLIAVGIAPTGDIHVVDADSGKPIHTFETRERGVDALLFSPGGRLVASRARDDIYVWDLDAGKAVVHITTPSWIENALALSPDGRTLASGHGTEGVRLWERSTGKELRWLQLTEDAVRCIAFSPDGKTIIAGTQRSSVVRWATDGGAQSASLKGFGEPIHAVAFSPDGEFIAAGGGDQVIHLWRSSTGERIVQPSGHEGHVESIDLSPDGRTVASGGLDRAVRLWKVSSGEEKFQLRALSPPVEHVVFSPLGDEVAAGGDDGAVRVWNASTGIERLVLRGHTSAIRCLSYSPDGLSIAAAGGDRTFRVWEAKTGKETSSSAELPSSVVDLTCSHTGEWMALGYKPDALLVWRSGEPSNPVKLASLHDTAAFFADRGRRVMTWDRDSREIHVWDAASGRQVGKLKDVPGIPEGQSTDGHVLFLADEEGGTLRLLETISGGEFLSVPSRLDHLYCARLSRNAEVLATVAQDSTILVWDMAPAEDTELATRWRKQPPGIQELWELLGSREARTAYAAQWRLAHAGTEVADFLGKRLLAPLEETPDTIRRLVSDLEADLPEARSRAQGELERLAPYFEEVIVLSKEKSTSVEIRNRLQSILDKIHDPTQLDQGRLQRLRAQVVLERLATDEASRVLRALAERSPIRAEREAAADAVERGRPR